MLKYFFFIFLYVINIQVFADPAREFTLSLSQKEWAEMGDPKYYENDHIILWDGTHLVGTVEELPPIDYSFGSIDFRVSEVAGVAFSRSSSNPKVQYVTRNGQNFIGKSAYTTWRFIKKEVRYEGENRIEDDKPVTLAVKDIRFALLKQRGGNQLLIHEQFVSVTLKSGDRFPLIPKTRKIRLFDGDREFLLHTGDISEVQFRGGLQGFLKGEALDHRLPFAFVKDHTFTGYLAKNRQELQIPWHLIDRVFGDEGRFVISSPYSFSKWGPADMIRIPPGRFVLGESSEVLLASNKLSPSAVSHTLGMLNRTETPRAPTVKVEVPGFYVDRYEVTNIEYAQFIEQTGHRAPPHWKGRKVPESLELHPVVNVSFSDAVAYAKWAGKRLPTEVEWERIAKGIEGRKYAYGNVYNSLFANTESQGTVAVGNYQERSKGQGALSVFDEVQDMTGNVSEWTASYFHTESYQKMREGVSAGPSAFRVVRGGSYQSSPHTATTTYRAPMHENDFNLYTGFRCVKER